MEEVARLREANARLNLERERSMGLRRAAETSRQITTGSPSAAPTPDDGWAALIEARVVRNELLFLTQDLRLALSFLERQLETLAPAVELDHRVNDRRMERPDHVMPSSWIGDEDLSFDRVGQDVTS